VIFGDFPHRLREALRQAEFTYQQVTQLLGQRAHLALARNETTPAYRLTADRSPRSTLIRLFLLQTAVSQRDAEQALPHLLPELAAHGILSQSAGEVVAQLDVRPYATDRDDHPDWWVVSDLTPGLDGQSVQVSADHVLGISAASTSLAELTLRHEVNSALDLGTGCGVQALHLAQHARQVVATDVNERALWVARLNAQLNECPNIAIREGSLFEPVAGQTFDLIATNPPFVISPATAEQLVYRDSGLPGDQVVERIVRGLGAHLSPGGWGQVLANWVITNSQSWEQRMTTWLPDECDAYVVQREVLDPAEYVELWLKDSGHYGTADYSKRYEAWLGWLDQQGVSGIGFGWINVHHVNAESPIRDFRDWPYAVEQPIAPAIADWAAGSGMSRTLTDELLLAAKPVRAEDILQETQGQPGAEDPAVVVLRQQRGLRSAHQVSSLEAAALGACDGELTIGQIVKALAQLTDQPEGTVAQQVLPFVRRLLSDAMVSL
jgi:methylase of polypeptide subunit release factors